MTAPLEMRVQMLTDSTRDAPTPGAITTEKLAMGAG